MTSEVFAPLDPRGAVLGDEVYTVLGEAILDGRLAPGERLRDTELAERLGVSRTPVREALQRLERSGLVEVSANRWTRVSIPDESMLTATHEFVTYIMGIALRMAIGRCTDPQLDELLTGVDTLIEASIGDDRPDILRASARFFTTVTSLTENRMLQNILEEQEFALRRNLYGWSPHVVEKTERTDMYRVLREAVAARDADRAERILRLQHGLGWILHRAVASSVGPMGHIELRGLDDDDLDAVFDMLRDPEAVARAAFTRADASDRASFDEWIAPRRIAPDVSLHVVTERGGFAGIAAAFTVDGDREVTLWIARHAWGRGVATDALRLLISHEATRPLFARVAARNAAAITVLEKAGFTEVSRSVQFAPGLGREVEERIYTLVPAVE